MSADLNLTVKQLMHSFLNEEMGRLFCEVKMKQISTNGQKITSGRAIFRALLIFSRKHARLENPPDCK